ncbi:hypothetical protein [Sphingomonas sp.]|uniref:hypothetical protein n=1 Tax=Sphingomonas sp. TaxID=28214 RepID=UPI00286E42F8|nr:hypothetical protein [Sphingomonas sp.]
MLKVVLALAAAGLAAAPAAANHAEAKVKEFAPYAFLIGEWDIHEEGAPPAAVHRATWGVGGTSIRLETDMLVAGKPVPHYEGILVWNPRRGDFDMLINLDPVSAKVQERGRVWLDHKNRSAVRDVVASYAAGVRGPDGKIVGPGGAEFVFQQRFKPVGKDRIETSMMRKTDSGWVATFPGSESILMTRRGS